MKHFFLFIMLALFPFLSLKSNELELSPVGSKKTRMRSLWLSNRHVIYFFTDNTIVYLRHPPYEKQTWGEWWNNTEHPQPDPHFYFQLEDWSRNSCFQLYRYHWHEASSSHILEPLFNNSNIATDFDYFIENSETGEKTLCQVWSLTDLGAFISRYGEERYHEGYGDGKAAAK